MARRTKPHKYDDVDLVTAASVLGKKKSKLLAGKEYSVTREKEKGQSHELKLETITYNHHYSTGVLN